MEFLLCVILLAPLWYILFRLQPDTIPLSRKGEITRATALFLQVIGELDAELIRLKENPKLSADFIAQKDAQIDVLVNYQNKADDLLSEYETAIRLLKIQNVILESMLSQQITQSETFSDYFLKTFTR